MTRRTEAELEKIREVAERYEQEGFRVLRQPGPESVPFDLHGFRPDLLVEKADQHFLLKVRAATGQPSFSLDRMMEVSREIQKRPGWSFYIVTANDVHEDAPGIADPLASWAKIRSRAADAIRLSKSEGATEAAVLVLWVAMEGILRKMADDARIPIERLPVAQVIPTLYSMGELTYEQYEVLTGLLGVRKRLLHGFDAPAADVTRASQCLVEILGELIREPLERAA
ncbi:MAG TPA: hypothetical protein VFJ16_22100 [Longimicrobium sp.]|nr:hypothetical protein [Longimicrobium sp.]